MGRGQARKGGRRKKQSLIEMGEEVNTGGTEETEARQSTQ